MFRKLRPTHKRILLDVSGWFFILFGFAGIFLPVIQGVLLMAIGFYLLSLHSSWCYKKFHSLNKKYPYVSGPIQRADNWVREQFGIELDVNKA